MTSLHPLPRIALFVGAHPDDIELGAGGTVNRLSNLGWSLWFCVLTSEADATQSAIRKREAAAAAGVLGVQATNLIFMDQPDAHLKCTEETVESFRRVLAERNLDPAVVFTHTRSDSHSDHRAAYDICTTALQGKLILSFAVVNSLERSDFKPVIFSNISCDYQAKLDALAKHQSQSQRIRLRDIQSLSDSYSAMFGFAYTEPFEILLQQGAEDMMEMLSNLMTAR